MRGRAPVRIRGGRSAGDVFAGLGALALLAALLGGVPYALLRFAGPPLTGELLSIDVLTRQVSGTTIVAVLILVVWLAWLQLAACVIVEVYAGIRRVGLPARVPLAGGTQAIAHRLVSAALLLFTLSAVVVPLTRFGGPPPAPRALHRRRGDRIRLRPCGRHRIRLRRHGAAADRESGRGPVTRP